MAKTSRGVNDAYVEQLLEDYLDAPASVPPEWREIFVARAAEGAAADGDGNGDGAVALEAPPREPPLPEPPLPEPEPAHRVRPEALGQGCRHGESRDGTNRTPTGLRYRPPTTIRVRFVCLDPGA